MIGRYYKNLWKQIPPVGRAMFPWDILRGFSHGAVSAVPVTFALYVAIEFFDASALQKSAIAAANFFGLLCSLPYAAWSPVIKRRPLRCFFPLLAAAAGLLSAAWAHSTLVYTCSVVAFGLFFNLSIPVLTAIYRDNYADIIRGRVFGITTSVAVTSGIITQYVGGQVLDLSLEWYRYVFSALSFMVAVGAFAIVRMPSNHQGNDLLGNPFSYLGLLRKHAMFRYVLFAWFLFGAANFALMPQRIEYLTQPEYGLEYNAALVFLVVGVSVESARLLAIQVWAYLFDHFNFIKLRILITSFILAFLLVFFHAKSLPMLVLGAALQGCAFGGGIIAWTLWVTKFAPKEQTTQFMAIHTFATGVRGTIAPLIGYGLAGHFGLHTAVWFSVTLTIVSIAMLWRIADQPIRMAGESSE